MHITDVVLMLNVGEDKFHHEFSHPLPRSELLEGLCRHNHIIHGATLFRLI